MSTRDRRFLLAAGVLGSFLIGAGPAFAQSHGGGGGHSSGGGGHASGGGHFGGGGGGHAATGGSGGGRYAAGAHFAAPVSAGYGRGGYAGAYRGGTANAVRGAYGHSGSSYYGGRSYTGDRSYYGGRGYYGHGYSTGAYWRGGYWQGGFWPRAYYGLGFSWFLPVLPLAYATYWWSGTPYYYANDVYYTYNPSYEGYVATDPPPIADSSARPEGAAPSAGGSPPGDAGALAGQIFMYPKNGQSPEQQATDKAECQQWAQEQAGQVAQNSSDYERAMAACVEGRGYSAK